MSQKLILPINNCNVNAGYKMPAYLEEWKFPHYGIDLGNPTGDRTVRSPGDGIVIAAGMDGNTPKERMGNAIVLVFPDVIFNDGRKSSLACRMFHFDSIAVTAGQSVKKGDILGMYGSTGQYVSGPHLHTEFDTDVDWPAYAYGIASSGKIIKKGSIDSTVDPSLVWFLGEGQQIRSGWGEVNGWVAANDINIPKLEETPPAVDYKALYEKEVQAHKETMAKFDGLVGEMQSLVQKYLGR